ncbi:type II toxin-antitoxin system VapC family toxin [Parapusillimonas sp. SGNA-6]|nr:type II toxin-antitoxin system VapC family toxin [Parapusillimonas sp. SGNA-6]
MIALDTNVVSELMKQEPEAAVRFWLNERTEETMYLSSVTLAELLFGIEALPASRRESMLDYSLTELLELFKDRVLSFDTNAARHYADLAVTTRNGGGGSPKSDGYIVGIAASRSLIVTSRDTSPYEAARVKVIYPWNIERKAVNRAGLHDTCPGLSSTASVIT